MMFVMLRMLRSFHNVLYHYLLISLSWLFLCLLTTLQEFSSAACLLEGSPDDDKLTREMEF